MSDELNPAAKGLVAAARRSGRALAPLRKERLRAGVTAAIATSSAAAAASVSLGKLVLVGTLSAALGSGATLLAVRGGTSVDPPAPALARVSRPMEPTAPTPSDVRPPATPAPPPIPAPPPRAVDAAPEARRTPGPSAGPRVAASETPPEPRVTSPAPAPLPAGLDAELELLRAAMTATQARRWDDAQQLLDEHQRRFTPAALASEARAIQVLVWCGVGRVDDARRVARELEGTDALNPAVQRLRTSCAW